MGSVLSAAPATASSSCSIDGTRKSHRSMPQTKPHFHRLCTAPMMDWSDRHCRFFFRQLSAACGGLHRDGDHRRADPWQCRTAPALPSPRASRGIAARRQRARGSRPLRGTRAVVRLRRGQSELRLPVRARAARRIRRLSDGGTATGGRLREGDAGCHGRSGHGEAPPGYRFDSRLRLRAPLRRGCRGARAAELFSSTPGTPS